MTAGEESAISLGVNYKKIRMIAFVLSTLLTAVAVSFTGVIGFVGLIAPPCYSYDSRQRLSLYDSGVFIGRSSFIATV